MANHRILIGVATLMLVAACNGGGETLEQQAAVAHPLTGGETTFVTPEDVETVTLADGHVVEAARDEVLVCTRQDITPDELDVLLAEIERLDGRVIGDSSLSRILQVRIPASASEADFIAAMRGVPAVVAAGLNMVVGVDGVSTIPDAFDGDYWIDHIRARQAWEITTGTTDSAIGIVDIGLNPGVVDSSRVEVYNIFGFPVVGSGEDHGTFVTGLAAGDGGDSVEDAVGVAWNSPVIFVDFHTLSSVVVGLLSTHGFVTSQVWGLETAIQKGARVVNLSAGPGPLCREEDGTEPNFLRHRLKWRKLITPVVDLARQRGVLLVFSAGNDGHGCDDNHYGDLYCNGERNDGPPTTTSGGLRNYNPEIVVQDNLLLLGSSQSPASWETNALIVAATNEAKEVAEFSRRGEVVNIAAPGEAVGYGGDVTGRGTSFAAPLVAGTAALVAGLDPTFSGTEIRQFILDAANPQPFGDKSDVGEGLLDAGRAVGLAKIGASAEVAEEIDVTLSKGELTTVNVSVRVPETSVRAMDVLFLVDTSGSYDDDIETYKQVAGMIIADISSLVPDVQFGVASFSDFPFDGYGSPLFDDEAFVLDQPITDDADAILRAIDLLNDPLNGGEDFQESQLEALYQVATGAGRDLNSDGDFDDLGEIRRLKVGWRSGALRVVILATDAGFHDRDVEPAYRGAGFVDTLAALQNEGIIVIGLDSGETGGDLQRVVDATGGLKFDLASDSSGVAPAIYEGVSEALTEVTLTSREFGDVEDFITSIEPEEHEGVLAGEERSFQIHLEGKLNNSTTDLERTLRLWFVAEGSALLKRVPVRIRIPAADSPR